MHDVRRDPGSEGARLYFRLTRLESFDYGQAGVYFITVCTASRLFLFGEVVDGKMRPNAHGLAVEGVWAGLPLHYPRVTSLAFALMPNHVHALIVLGDAADETTETGRGRCKVHGLTEIVRAFKSFSAREVNRTRQSPGEAVWQRGYYEHVVRDDESLERIHQYIANNPMQWTLDSENPEVRRNSPTSR